LQAGLAKHGVEAAAVQVMPLPSTFALGRDGLSLLLERCPAMDAVVCSSDTLAHGVLTEAIARGLSVPGQLAVVGFGDLNFAARTYPPLSTVRVDGANIGRVAAQAILDRLDGKAVAGLTDTGFQFIQRGST
jgi:LacI family gluconate utilization system Gnt-I transcriptional repressor